MALLDNSPLIQNSKLNISFWYVDSLAKIFLILYHPFENFTTHIAILCIDTKIFSEIKSIAKIKSLEFIDLKLWHSNDNWATHYMISRIYKTKLRVFKNLLTNQIVLTKNKTKHKRLILITLTLLKFQNSAIEIRDTLTICQQIGLASPKMFPYYTQSPLIRTSLIRPVLIIGDCVYAPDCNQTSSYLNW